jgi:quercetin dioxygenase-like cupin family protein/heme-degrading monooxygenase HmoA
VQAFEGGWSSNAARACCGVIARSWRGAVKTEDADGLRRLHRRDRDAHYVATPGNRGAWMLTRELGELTEFVMFTLWDSLDAVQAFAGDEYETAVFYPEDDRYLVERDLTSTTTRWPACRSEVADLRLNIAHEFVGADHGGVGVCVIIVEAPPGRGPSLHTHPYEELLLVQEGSGTFTLGDETLEVGAGELVVVPPGVPHGLQEHGRGRAQADRHPREPFLQHGVA